MRRMPALSGLFLIALLAIAPAADARRDLRCNRVLSGRTVKGDLVVPAGGVCRLKRVIVRGDVAVRAGGYLQATRTTVRGDVGARRALTLFLDGGSMVDGWPPSMAGSVSVLRLSYGSCRTEPRLRS